MVLTSLLEKVNVLLSTAILFLLSGLWPLECWNGSVPERFDVTSRTRIGMLSSFEALARGQDSDLSRRTCSSEPSYSTIVTDGMFHLRFGRVGQPKILVNVMYVTCKTHLVAESGFARRADSSNPTPSELWDREFEILGRGWTSGAGQKCVEGRILDHRSGCGVTPQASSNLQAFSPKVALICIC